MWRTNRQFVVIQLVLMSLIVSGMSFSRPVIGQTAQVSPTPTIDYLQVLEVQPPDGATQVSRGAKVMVFFDRPVVSLADIDETANQPALLTFEPPVGGRGEWIDTATYQFVPDSAGFRRATQYTVRLKRGLANSLGEAILAEDYEWQFTIISPTPTPPPTPTPTPVPLGVIDVSPENQAENIGPNTAIRLTFSAPMYRRETQEAFKLVKAGQDDPIAGEFDWQESPEQLIFKPAAPLDPAATYRVTLPQGLQAEVGLTRTADDFQASFTTAPLPEIVSLSPQKVIDPGQDIAVTFKTSMDRQSVILGETLLITPTVLLTQVQTYWQHSRTKPTDTELRINLPLEFSQQYTITFGADIQDVYAQPLGVTETLVLQTKPQAALLFIETPDPIMLYNGYTKTEVLVTARNVSQINFELYRLPLTDLMTIQEDWRDIWPTYTPDAGNLLKAWTFDTNLPLNHKQLFTLDLGANSGLGEQLPPGLYFLETYVNQDDLYPEVDWTSNADSQERHILVVSKRAVTFKESPTEALVWLTDLQSGRPVANQSLTLVTSQTVRARAETAEDGVARLDYRPTNDETNSHFLVVGNPDGSDDNFALSLNQWTEGIELYQFDDVRIESSQALYYGYFYTHRGLYRPGETVYFKGIIRRNDDATYALPTAFKTVEIIITDEQGKEVYNEALPLNEMGTVNGTFHLEPQAGLGEYRIQADYAGQMFYDSFEVQAYRLPEFQLEVATNEARYAQGETISATASASFFFGGPVSNAQVSWALFAEDYSYRYRNLDAYDFVDDTYQIGSDDDYRWGFGELIAEGSGQTDENGYFTFEVTADAAESRFTQLYTLDVIVTDLNNQQVAVQARVLVHKSRFLVGLRPEKRLGEVGQANRLNVLLVDWSRQPVANQPVQLIVAEYNRYSTQIRDPDTSYYTGQDSYYWRTVDEERPIITTTVTTDENGRAEFDFQPTAGGIYKIMAAATDAEDNIMRSSTFIWISGPDYVNWGQGEADRFQLVADKTAYNIGETANILVPHPYSGTVMALVTWERGRIHRHVVTELTNNSQQLAIPITEDMLPNIYISVVVVQGSQPIGFTSATELLPSFKLAYIDLPINPAAKELNIVLTADKPTGESYQPREAVSYDIQVTNAQNQPVQAELSLALVDQAVLSLAPETPGQLLKRFWQRRGLGVQTASSLTKAIDRYHARLASLKGGDGCVDCGGLGEKGFGKTRRNFLDTALWVADFITDQDGRGTVTATLPDNLTTWTLTGIGVTGASTLVGEGTTNIVSTQPVLVRPVTPRFFVVGDEAQLGLIVQNNSEQSQEIETSFEAAGLTINDWRLEGEETWHNQGRPRLTVESGERTKIEYRVTVEVGSTSQLTMTAIGGDYQDSLTFNIPVYRASTPETVGTAGMLEETGQRTEAIELPEEYDPTQGNLTVSLDGSLAGGLRDGLDYLEHFPYECTEQTVSRFLPNVVTFQAYQNLNLANPELAAKLPDLVSLGQQRLYNHQHTDGGWGWWVDDASHPYLTAYVLQGLLEAQRAGFEVDQTVVELGLTYLTKQLVAPKDIRSAWQANQQAFLLYVLAEGGAGDLGRSVALFDNRERLDNFGRAYLAMAIHLLDEEARQVEILVNDLATATIVSATGVHWEEQSTDYRAMNTDTRTTAIVIGALSRIEPAHPLLPKAVRWLMTRRSHGGYWATTQETAWAIMGLTNWMMATGELAGNYEWHVSLNEQLLGQGDFTPATIDETRKLRVEVADLLADAVNRLVIERRSGSATEEETAGQLYYTAYLTYYQPAEEAEAIDRGIRVSRLYRLPEDSKQQPINGAQVGQVIEVQVTVIAPTELHYVMVEDPLPAGTEAINPDLATSSLADQLSPSSSSRSARYFDHVELRDEKAVLFATYLPKGTYRYTYLVRATTPGRYRVIPTHAEQMYFPEIFGRGEGMIFTVYDGS